MEDKAIKCETCRRLIIVESSRSVMDGCKTNNGWPYSTGPIPIELRKRHRWSIIGHTLLLGSASMAFLSFMMMLKSAGSATGIHFLLVAIGSYGGVLYFRIKQHPERRATDSYICKDLYNDLRRDRAGQLPCAIRDEWKPFGESPTEVQRNSTARRAGPPHP